MPKETLKFSPCRPEGFRSGEISAYDDIDPDIILRELIQNAQDAFFERNARIKKKEKCACIRFQIEEIETRSIPAYSEYAKHFESACITQEAENAHVQVEKITNKIREDLEGNTLSVLWAMDNGIGLNERHMKKILSDGQSEKASADSSGSYGNGHFSAFLASDLRYIIYGSVFQEKGKKRRIISGHAILASHEYKPDDCGKDGYLVAELRQKARDPYDFYSADEDIPQILKEKLDWVEENYGTGSVVGILGFNKFRQYDSDAKVLDKIVRVAATHFAPAIYTGEMVVHASAPQRYERERTVNENTLGGILSKYQENKRAGSKGPNGMNAWEAFQTLSAGEYKKIEVLDDDITVCIREYPKYQGSTRLQLFRNGMWITDKIQKNHHSDFSKSVPFNAVILLDRKDAKNACDLARDAEGASHIGLKATRVGDMHSDPWKKFYSFLRALHDGIVASVSERDNKEVDLGVLPIGSPGQGLKQDGNPNKLVGRDSVEITDDPHHSDTLGDKKGPESTRDSTPRSNSHTSKRRGATFEALTVSTWNNKGMRIAIKPLEEAKYVELRLFRESGSDGTCDLPLPGVGVEIGKGATVDGEHADAVITDKDEASFAIALGELNPDGSDVLVEVPCLKPSGNIQVELVKRAPPK